MITTVLFDMGGTLEDIWVDEESSRAAIAALDGMLKGWGMDPGVDLGTLRSRVDEGWKRYDVVRSAADSRSILSEGMLPMIPFSYFCTVARVTPTNTATSSSVMPNSLRLRRSRSPMFMPPPPFFFCLKYTTDFLTGNKKFPVSP